MLQGSSNLGWNSVIGWTEPASSGRFGVLFPMLQRWTKVHWKLNREGDHQMEEGLAPLGDLQVFSRRLVLRFAAQALYTASDVVLELVRLF